MSEAVNNLQPLVMAFLNQLMSKYWHPMFEYVERNIELRKSISGFLLHHKKINIYIGRTHIALEYFGSEVLENFSGKSEVEINLHDFALSDQNILEQIIGFTSDSTVDMVMPLMPFSEDFICPTNRGWDKLMEIGWNVAAQNSIIAFNGPIPTPIAGQFCRIVNGRFFDADNKGIIVRHVKWMDFYPISIQSIDDETESFRFNIDYMSEMVESDSRYIYPIPSDYKFIQLPKINRFVELWGRSDIKETDITSFLARPENDFILTMKFGAKEVRPELICEWQSQDRASIKPDFFLVQPNGYADIVEFKMPDLYKSIVVGKENRGTIWLTYHVLHAISIAPLEVLSNVQVKTRYSSSHLQ